MKCQRSGYCCISATVIIVMDDDEEGLGLYAKPAGVRCPHLSFDGDTASCAVHDEPWYWGTPCHVHQNPDMDPDYFGKENIPCRVGLFQLGKTKSLGTQPTRLERLEDFNPEDLG